MPCLCCCGMARIQMNPKPSGICKSNWSLAPPIGSVSFRFTNKFGPVMDSPSPRGEMPKDFLLGRGHVHVWKLSLEPSTLLLDRFAGVLCPAEQQRAARFHFDRDRIHFIAGRGLLRLILALYLRIQPAQIALIYGPYGKPALALSANHNRLKFNLAHSDS